MLRKKKGKEKEKLNTLAAQTAELEDHKDELSQVLEYLFKGVFVHRFRFAHSLSSKRLFRDVHDTIRALSIEELGVWMDLYGSHFLQDTYLKYFGWSLYDPSSDVRMKSLNALIPLYESPEVCFPLFYGMH